MTSHREFKVLLRFLAAGAMSLAFIAGINPRSAPAQSLVLDFQFDASSGGGTSQAITSTGQTFTIDVFATVTGTAGSNPTQAQLQQLGIQLLRFGARSSVTGNGAFAVGSTSTTGGNAGVGITAASAIQNPFNNPGAIGPQGDFNGDGINDLGGATKTTISIAQNSSSTQFGASGFGSQVGTSDAWRWMLETFTVTVGATTGKTGTTLFTPTVVGTGASTWTTDGATTADNITTWTPGTAVTFTVGGVGPGNDSTLNMQPATVTINTLASGTRTTNLTVTNTAADAATATGAFTGAFTGTSTGASQVITGSPVGTTPGNAAITYAAGSTIGQVTFGYTITNSSNSADAQGASTNKSTAFTVNVGNATADNNGQGANGAAPFAGATQMTATVAHNGSYAGLSSQVTSLNGTGGFNADDGSAAHKGGTATILAGTNTLANAGGSATVLMQWRTLSTATTNAGFNEQTGAGPGFKGKIYNASLNAPTTGLVSDVVDLEGLTPGAESAGGATDPFVLQMSFNPLLTAKHGTVVAGLAANKLINLLSFNTTTGLWDRAVDDNTGNAITSPLDPSYGYVGSYAQYISAGQPGNGKTLAQTLGAWGVDPTNDVVWADVNHNSQFAVVPEPATILLAGLGLLGLVGLRRRINVAA